MLPEANNSEYLVFESRDNFESYLNEGLDQEENLVKKGNNFIPLAQDNEAKVNLGIDDEFIANLLNKDGIVQIGDWIIKVDLANQKVTALNKENSKYYNDLKIGNPIDNVIIHFSTEDDVLGLLETGQYSDINARMLSCAPGPPILPLHQSNGAIYESRTGERYASWYTYTKYGIYFTLEYEFGSGDANVRVERDRLLSYKQQCYETKFNNSYQKTLTSKLQA